MALSDIRRKRTDILRIAAKYGAHEIRIFGSVVRGEADDDSDVDLLVKLDDDRSLLDHIALIRELEGLLGCRVDVVTEDALHQAIRSRVLAAGVPL